MISKEKNVSVYVEVLNPVAFGYVWVDLRLSHRTYGTTKNRSNERVLTPWDRQRTPKLVPSWAPSTEATTG